ncbi:MAG TPA: hypothetical protein VH092_30740 [Urbifossiella sp.]|nr:hypothetical protein [Urbifossiella sp.]
MDGRNRLLEEFNAVRNALFTPDEEPRWQAERLANSARAELARAGLQDDLVAVDQAGNWVGEVGTQWQIGAARPWRHHDEELRMVEVAARIAAGEPLGRGRFDEEGDLLSRYRPIRQAVLKALTRTGCTIPAGIDRRAALASNPWQGSLPDPITQTELLGWAMATMVVLAEGPLPPKKDATASNGRRPDAVDRQESEEARAGRRPDKTTAKVKARVAQLRAKGKSWDDIGRAIQQEFGRKHTNGTLQRYEREHRNGRGSPAG